MSEVITFQNILDQADDFGQNYTTSTIDLGNKKRAGNRAIEYVQRRLGLPSDKKIYSFLFFEDQLFYNMPDGFNEPVKLYYNTTSASVSVDQNYSGHKWWGSKDTELLTKTAPTPSKNETAYTTINGSSQMILLGKNLQGRQIIQGFDSTSGLTNSSSVTSVTVDTNIKKQGYGSVKFNVDSSESTSTFTMTGSWNVQSYLNQSGAYRMWVFFPTGATTQFSSIGIRLTSSTGNYYDITTTTQYDSSAWASNTWNKLSFSLANVTTTGTPDSTAITSIQIRLNHSGSFTSVSNMRFDELFLLAPDLLDLIYYTSIKGTDSTGVTNKIILTEYTDILNFGPIAPDLLLPIALKTATILWPQLKSDINFLQIYKADFEDTLKVFGKIYPRERMTGTLGQTILAR